MSAGYSKRSLVDKLGIRPGASVLFVGPPDGYDATLGQLPPGVKIRARATGATVDFIQVFVSSRADLAKRLPGLKKALAKTGALWVSWPKKASKVPTDVTEDVVRELALALGLVDVKVCAVDDVWSGLKLVYRLKDR